MSSLLSSIPVSALSWIGRCSIFYPFSLLDQRIPICNAGIRSEPRGLPPPAPSSSKVLGEWDKDSGEDAQAKVATKTPTPASVLAFSSNPTYASMAKDNRAPIDGIKLATKEMVVEEILMHAEDCLDLEKQ